VEELGRQAHELVRLLEGLAADAQAAPGKSTTWQVVEPRLRKLHAQAEAARLALAVVEGLFREHINGLEQADLPRVWRAIDDALVVPFRDAKLRMLLLARKGRIAGRFLAESSRGTNEAALLSASVNDQRARDAARRQGQLALAVLGPTWFDECPGDGRETFEQVQRRLSTFTVEARWWESLTEAGAQIGLRWQRLPDQITALAQGSRKGELAEARVALRTADRLTRLLDGAGSLRLTLNPPEGYRRLLVQDLLLLQTERTTQDYWAAEDEDPARTPYFRTAGQVFLNDARRIDPRHPGLAQAQGRLDSTGRLVLTLEAPGKDRPADGPAMHLTSEDELPVQYFLQSAGGRVPSGFPVVRLKTDAGLKLIAPAGAEEGVKPWQEDGKALPLACAVSSPLTRQAEAEPPLVPGAKTSDLTVSGLYRGHRFTLPVRVYVHPLAENIKTDHALPPRAGLAIRGPRVLQEYAPGRGAVAIVLDCSRSMGPPRGKSFDATTKYAQATAALRQVLAKLPRGTTVSLWVFGQATGAEKTAKAAEDTIRQIQPPVAWDPDNAAQLRGLMSKVEWPALEPWNQSPIIRAMVQAAQKDLAGVRTYKTLLVITDGMDNRFDQDTKLNPDRKDTRTFFREYFRDIEVDVIGFKVTSTELAKARAQFQVVEELPLPGKFYTVSDGPALVGTLHKVLRQKLRYYVDLRDNHPLRGEGDDLIYLSEDDANDQWLPGGLEPGTYKVRVQTSRRLTRSIHLEPGDRLLLELNPDRVGGTGEESREFERLLYSQTFFPWKPYREKNRWRLAVVQNQLVGERGMQMLVTLEEQHDSLASVLQQIKPVTTWMEVSLPPGLKAPFCQRWHYQAGYPAPAWSIDVPLWPRPAAEGEAGGPPPRPELRVWWSPDQEPYGASLERGHDFAVPQDIVAKTLSLKDEKVIVESVRVEQHVVETRPAERDRPALREEKTCLVVRVAHAADRPVWVRLRGLETAGAEHRFYREAGKYTALFWPVRPGDVEKLRTIEVFSLKAFKDKAERRGFALHLQNLYEPQVNDVRPLPPMEPPRQPGGVPPPPVPRPGAVSAGPVLEGAR
jgi:hypothetical protein